MDVDVHFNLNTSRSLQSLFPLSDSMDGNLAQDQLMVIEDDRVCLKYYPRVHYLMIGLSKRGSLIALINNPL